MIDTSAIREHMEVVGSDGQHVGTVDHLDGTDRIRLTKNDRDAGGKHHYIPTSWVANVGTEVRLNKSATEAKGHWFGGEARTSG